MAKKYYDFKIELTIDGEFCPPGKASPMFQTDPFPGGHRYSCMISGARLARYFYYLAPGQRREISPDDGGRFLLSLGLFWGEDEVSRLEYFLNSVEELDFDGERIEFSGTCSPVLCG